jgi:hypothetical protein
MSPSMLVGNKLPVKQSNHDSSTWGHEARRDTTPRISRSTKPARNIKVDRWIEYGQNVGVKTKWCQ